MCTNFLFCTFQEYLSDGKDNNEQCTRVCLHLLEGEGDHEVVEGVNSCAKFTFVIREKFMDDKIKDSWRTKGKYFLSSLGGRIPPTLAFLWFFLFS